MLNRRQFLGLAGAAASPLIGLGGCLPRMPFPRGAGPRNWHQFPADWDPVFGPPIQWFSRYGGPGDYEAHLRAGAAPGVDYDVPAGTPLVPPMGACLLRAGADRRGSRFLLLGSITQAPFQVGYGHLERSLLDGRYRAAGMASPQPGPVRVLDRGEIVAFSGNSGAGPPEYGGVQPPHLHFSAFWDDGKRPYQDLNPEKFGPDGGRPVFWDGETPLDTEPEARPFLLARALRDFERDGRGWEGTAAAAEARGTLLEFARSMGDPAPQKILESKAFQALKSHLREAVLEGKRFPPGSAAYRLMLKVFSYSTDPGQRVILTLPFIAPGLETVYRESVFEKGQFLTILPASARRLRQEGCPPGGLAIAGRRERKKKGE